MKQQIDQSIVQQAIRYRSGCKVCWYIFASKEIAEEASKVALLLAVEAAKQGFDFGYQSPGAVQKVSWPKLTVDATARWSEGGEFGIMTIREGTVPRHFKAGDDVAHLRDEDFGTMYLIAPGEPRLIFHDNPAVETVEGWEVCFP